MARKKVKRVKAYGVRVKDPSKSAREFMKTVKSGKGNLGKGFFKI
jgi:hypothetical protein